MCTLWYYNSNLEQHFFKIHLGIPVTKQRHKWIDQQNAHFGSFDDTIRYSSRIHNCQFIDKIFSVNYINRMTFLGIPKTVKFDNNYSEKVPTIGSFNGLKLLKLKLVTLAVSTLTKLSWFGVKPLWLIVVALSEFSFCCWQDCLSLWLPKIVIDIV